jgi:hypothetical protein
MILGTEINATHHFSGKLFQSELKDFSAKTSNHLLRQRRTKASELAQKGKSSFSSDFLKS